MLVIAHRGASGIAPENTLLGIWTALASADLIEFDVQVTKDKQLVIFHDRSLERITGEQDGIADFTLKELEKKDIGKWKDPSFTGITISTLEQVLQEIPEKVGFVIEVKPQHRDVEKGRFMERTIVELLDEHRKRGLGDGYISVRDVDTWDWFHKNAPRYACGLMQKKRSPEEFLELVKKYKIPISQIRWKNYSNPDIQLPELRKTGTKIFVYFADTPKEWDELIRQKINGILTNYPSLLRGYLLYRKFKEEAS